MMQRRRTWQSGEEQRWRQGTRHVGATLGLSLLAHRGAATKDVGVAAMALSLWQPQIGCAGINKFSMFDPPISSCCLNPQKKESFWLFDPPISFCCLKFKLKSQNKQRVFLVVSSQPNKPSELPSNCKDLVLKPQENPEIIPKKFLARMSDCQPMLLCYFSLVGKVPPYLPKELVASL